MEEIAEAGLYGGRTIICGSGRQRGQRPLLMADSFHCHMGGTGIPNAVDRKILRTYVLGIFSYRTGFYQIFYDW